MLAQYLSYEFIALFMFITMLVMMFTGQRVFGAIGFVAAASALLIWGEGSMEMPYTATWKLKGWFSNWHHVYDGSYFSNERFERCWYGNRSNHSFARNVKEKL